MPFSSFERSKTRIRLKSLGQRFGCHSIFATVAPPEHDDVLLLKIELMRKRKAFNLASSIKENKEREAAEREAKTSSNWDKLPLEIKESPRLRLCLASKAPAQCVFMFERVVNAFLKSILRCQITSETRISKAAQFRDPGVYGTVAAFCGVIEAQRDGRLHLHLLGYLSRMIPSLLSKTACSEILKEKCAKWIDSTCATHVSKEAHAWLKRMKDNKIDLPRAPEIELPLAREDFQGYKLGSERKICGTNWHTHSFTCEKGWKGKFVCRLCVSRRIELGETRPIIVSLKTKRDFETKQKSEFLMFMRLART